MLFTVFSIWVFLTKTAKCQLAALVKNTQYAMLARLEVREILGTISKPGEKSHRW